LGTTGLALYWGGKGSFSAEMPETSRGGTFSLDGGVRVFAGYGYFAGKTTHTETAHTFGSSSVNADKLQAEVSIGVFFKVGPLEPPGAEEEIDAGASMTVGLKFQFGRPDPENDLYERDLDGDHCYDVNLVPFIDVGAELKIPFFPDVSFDFFELDIGPFNLYAGPCWGYTGTVATTATYNVLPSEESCDVVFCGQGKTISETVTKTLVPQAASFTQFVDAQLGGAYGSPIAEPYTYEVEIHDTEHWQTSMDPFGLPPGPEVDCSSKTDTDQFGSVFWDPDQEAAWAWFLEGWADNVIPYANSGIPGASITETLTNTGGDPAYCGATQTFQTSAPAYDSQALAAVSTLMGSKTINLTLHGSADGNPDHAVTTVVHLTRADDNRD
jgi:hypothetical protein